MEINQPTTEKLLDELIERLHHTPYEEFKPILTKGQIEKYKKIIEKQRNIKNDLKN